AHVDDAAGDVLVGASDEGHDHDEGGDSQDDAEEHEERAQLVRAQGFERDEGGLAQGYTLAEDGLTVGHLGVPMYYAAQVWRFLGEVFWSQDVGPAADPSPFFVSADSKGVTGGGFRKCGF